jgi:predicted O-methyltransferase YrrM
MNANATPPRPTLDDVIARAHALNMLQQDSELKPFCAWLNRTPINNFLEIGTYTGASFTVWDRISGPGIHIALDSNNERGIILPRENLRGRQYLFSKLQPTVHMLIMDSQQYATVQTVRKILGGQALDFLFIDGDHHKGPCMRDFVTYGQFVRKGGVIAFHDIAKFPGVKLTWQILTSRGVPHIEFLDATDPWGIGALKV